MKKHNARKRAAALLAAAAVAGGGAFAAVEATSSSPAAAQSTTTAAGPAALRAALTSKGTGRWARLRRLGGLYGQYTFQAKDGPRTVAFERGTVTAASQGDVVIRAADGTTFTWAITSTTIVRQQGKKEPDSALASGETVIAGGPVTSGTKTARIILIRKAASSKTSATA
jgi:hypothetical protein